jgi:hypothetical protein
MKHNRATNSAKKITRYLAGIAATTLLITGITIPLTAAPAHAQVTYNSVSGCTARRVDTISSNTSMMTRSNGTCSIRVRAHVRLANGTTHVTPWTGWYRQARIIASPLIRGEGGMTAAPPLSDRNF